MSAQRSEGWGMSVRQQAGAFCRVNRAQPTNRASGVSCTAWFGGNDPLFYLRYNVTSSDFDSVPAGNLKSASEFARNLAVVSELVMNTPI